METIEGDKIRCGVYEQAHWPPVANGEVESEHLVQQIVIYHYPNAESLVSGEDLGHCRCMRVANYISRGVSLIALDCGTQSTQSPELVPVIKGARVKIGGVQILLIDAKEAADFWNKKKTESEEQCSLIKADIERLQAELNAKQAGYVEAPNVASPSYTNDPRYIALINEFNNAAKTVQTTANAVNSLRSKYGTRVYSGRITKEKRQAWDAEEAGMQQIESIRRDEDRIRREIDSFPAKFRNEKDQRRQTAMTTIKARRIHDELDKANQTLKSFQTPYFDLAGFSPAALEMSLTDEKGHFVLHSPSEGTKVFAKLKSDETSEQFFWLVDLPRRGKKLIFSDKNLFTISTNLP
jgi:hypothetical protein